jgi:hypothetical protein
MLEKWRSLDFSTFGAEVKRFNLEFVFKLNDLRIEILNDSLQSLALFCKPADTSLSAAKSVM